MDEEKKMRLISWNIAGRVKKLPEQINALATRKPDVVALQEVTKSNGPLLRGMLNEIGLTHIADTVAEAIKHKRRYAVLIAGRWPFRPLPAADFNIPWPERLLSVVINSPWQEIELHTTYVPTGATKAGSGIKLETLEGIFARLACRARFPRILCGDFNIPQAETPTGQLITFGQTIKETGQVTTKRTLHQISGQRWDRAERLILTDLAHFDLADTYRALNGYQAQASSWYAKNRGRHFGFRLDHVFAGQALNPIRCVYLHTFRQAGLSDHAPIEVDFAPMLRSPTKTKG